jgi:hypothetical protein
MVDGSTEEVSYFIVSPFYLSLGLYYKTFYSLNLRKYFCNKSVCPWQASLA